LEESDAAIAVAMSGGLDSSVAALLLARRGSAVIGLSMLLWDHSADATDGRCCGSLDLADARRVASQVGIPHYTLRVDREFRDRVVDPFVEDYLRGRTPSPCVRCNTWIKFDLFVERARALGAATIATGHYARIVEGSSGPQLHTAVDAAKDQSYFLFELTQEQLASTRFPLGEMHKDETRRLAREAGLLVAEKDESMDVCFVSRGVRTFIEAQSQERPERFSADPAPALVMSSEGRELGRGAPYYGYTVGQRRGLGISAAEKLYVLNVDAVANRVVVGPRRQLARRGLLGERVHWISRSPLGAEEVTVKIRSRHPGVKASVTPRRGGRNVDVRFAEPQEGVAPGQAAVFYQGTEVLGGCWITGALD
jgi:tRNA-specific 2-thiouridylase